MTTIQFKKSDFLTVIPKLIEITKGLKDKKEYVIEIKEYREKRSLDANAYCWTLIDKLTEKTGIPKIEIYRDAIKNIGGNSETVCVVNEAVDKLINGWQHNGIGWVTDTYDSKIKGCTNVILYYGSSMYDTKQMARLIDNIIQECKQQDIETLPPHKIEGMLKDYEKQEK